MIKIIFILIVSFFTIPAYTSNQSFENWKIDFKKYALKKNISKKTLEITIDNVIFLPKVIKYDRFQPEFYEDTKTYISKRTSLKKINKGKDLYYQNIDLIDSIDLSLIHISEPTRRS